MSTNNNDIQSASLSCEDCESKALLTKKPTKEEHESATLNLSSKVLPAEVSVTDGSQVVTMCLSSKALSPKSSTKKEVQPRDTSCEDCESKELLTTNPTKEQFNLFSLSASLLNEVRPVKILSHGSQSHICDTCVPCEERATKILTYEEIHARSETCCEALFTNISTESSQNTCCRKLASAGTESGTISPNSQIRAMGPLSPLDPSSYSRPELAIIKHISLNLNVDFATHVLSGQAKIDFDVLHDINDLVLDASGLNVDSIEAEDGSQLQYKMGEHLPNMGSKLTILLPKQLTAGEKQCMASSKTSEDAEVSSKPCPNDNNTASDGCSPSRDVTPLAFNGYMYKPTMGCSKDGNTISRVSFSTSVDRCCDTAGTSAPEEYDGHRQCMASSKTSEEAEVSKKPCSNDNNTASDGCSPTGPPRDVTPLAFNGYMYKPTMGSSKDGNTISRVSFSTSVDRCCDTAGTSAPEEYDGHRLTVTIKYSTDPQASALQWLDPEQTSGKKHPYLFSQCQPIHARSILPCQDTPAVKFTYDAEVTAPEEFTVLMSALRGEAKSNKTTFRQPMPLPSYLVAIAVGVLESRTLGPRSKVWSEKEEIERSAWEFAETEKYLQAAEKLCGPYEWTQYDLLVLPPSFPYGGMENPCLTFVTPTLLAGDRSQADVIVHEIMHSWTGNLVTNRNFEHFWLNEGFTVFLERKVGASLINDSVEAKKSRDFHSLLGLQELNEAIEVFGKTSPLTNLVVDLDGIHPDDAFSRVPYEKGSLFLRYLEDQVGGPEVFDDFLRAYLTKFRKKSLDTEQFKRFLLNYFKDNAALKEVDWDTWFYKSGMPPIIPDYDTTMTKAISALIVKINDPNASISEADVKSFTPHQMIHLLQRLIDQPALPLDRLTTLGAEFKVNGNKNSEILYRWLRLCVRSRDQTKIGEVFNFVNNQGRMKYVRPLYRDLYAWEDVRQQAIDNFLKNEKYMMHVSAYTLRKDLHLAEANATTE